jgi:hypothetical protein
VCSSDLYWAGVFCYGNGRFVTISRSIRLYEGSNIAAYSEDGIKWKKTTMPVEAFWNNMC